MKDNFDHFSKHVQIAQTLPHLEKPWCDTSGQSKFCWLFTRRYKYGGYMPPPCTLEEVPVRACWQADIQWESNMQAKDYSGHVGTMFYDDMRAVVIVPRFTMLCFFNLIASRVPPGWICSVWKSGWDFMQSVSQSFRFPVFQGVIRIDNCWPVS